MAIVKVTIVGGAGGVGASTAFNLVLLREGTGSCSPTRGRRCSPRIVMDLEQVLELSPGCTVHAGDRGDAADADVIVVLSASPLTVGTSRLEYLAKNARIVDELADVLDPAWPGVLVVVTNPVDPLVTRLHRRTGLERRRIVGYTLNDSLRLRTGLARALGVRQRHRRGLGGRRARRPERPAPRPRHGQRGAGLSRRREQAAVALEYFRNWYVRHVALDSGRSSTWTSGLALARMVSARTHSSTAELWPASVVLDGEYGIDGVAVSVPVTLGARGVEEIHEWELSPSDLEALRASAEVVRTAVESIE